MGFTVEDLLKTTAQNVRLYIMASYIDNDGNNRYLANCHYLNGKLMEPEFATTRNFMQREIVSWKCVGYNAISIIVK